MSDQEPVPNAPSTLAVSNAEAESKPPVDQPAGTIYLADQQVQQTSPSATYPASLQQTSPSATYPASLQQTSPSATYPASLRQTSPSATYPASLQQTSPGASVPHSASLQASPHYPGPPPSQTTNFSYPPPSPYLEPPNASYIPTNPPGTLDLQISPNLPSVTLNKDYRPVSYHSPMAGPGTAYPTAAYYPQHQEQGHSPIQPATPYQPYPLMNPAVPSPHHRPIEPATTNPPKQPTGLQSTKFYRSLSKSSQGGRRASRYIVFATENPVQLTCPICDDNVITSVTQEAGTLTWVVCCILFLLTGICCLIPFMIKSCQETVHKCPRCGFTFGK